MIRQIEIEGFKSIDRLKFRPGRVTVLIGENGCGKSNILEAIAMAEAAAARKLDHEFLASRGIRVTDSRVMVPAFPKRSSKRMCVSVAFDEVEEATVFHLTPRESEGVSDWRRVHSAEVPMAQLRDMLDKALRMPEERRAAAITSFFSQAIARSDEASPSGFLVYAPENTALRTFMHESQILPLGIRGEGLFAHLRTMRAKHPQHLEQISQKLELIDWFDGLLVPETLAPGEHRVDIHDRYLDPLTRLDQRSANEGFLFLLFYFTLLISPDTPRFFAIDNVDASLNPRLCNRLMREIAKLTKVHDRQVILTTHNPAILDGLDLEDDEQRLFVVSRRPDGPTRIRRVKPPKPVGDESPMRLSEAFIWGHLGGLPTNF